MRIPFYLMFIVMALLPVSVPGQEAAGPQLPEAGPQAPAPQGRLVRFQSMARFQVEVWIDGRRAGFTPFQARLAEGSYLMTATAESLAPIVERLVVGPETDSVWIPPMIVTRENYQRVTEGMVRRIVDNPGNHHLLIASLLLSIDETDTEDLLKRADAAIPGDPMVDVARAGHLLRREDADGALVAIQRALVTLGGVSFAWRRLAEVHLARGEKEEALEAANQAVVLDSRGWRNLRVRARVHEALGNSSASEADRERADELFQALHRLGEGLRNR